MKYRISTDLAIRKIEETVFILDRKHSVLHSFNDTGAFLWEQLQQNTPVADLEVRLSGEFEVSQDQAARDVTEFLNALEKQQLIAINP